MSSEQKDKQQDSAEEKEISSQGEKNAPSGAGEKKGGAADGFYVVAVGASAGGLEALENLFTQMPAETGAAFVVVQHLAPDRDSYTPELLARKTEMQVVEAEQDMALEPNVVYVKSPKKMLSIKGRAFQLIDPKEGRDRYLPIDLFFRDLADDQGEKAVAVILSGAGSDGSHGLRSIHRAGGTVFVQDPEQAAHKGMPRSAIETGLADLVLPVEKMPRELAAYMQHPFLRKGAEKDVDQEQIDGQLPAILRTLRSKTGQDFSRYKKNTVRRRIQRRMAIQHMESIEDYARFLKKSSDEAETLFRDLLINVTNFFRDPDAFESLKKRLSERLEERDAEEEFRVWCPGCATGEEAYSIAMLLLELYEEKKIAPATRIFATDLNSRAIDYARDAQYPENIAADIDEQRLKRFFQKKGVRYKADSRLREMVVFASHNLTSAPPFSRLDLVSCRNLLIYLDSSLQKKLIPLLHYSLRPGGLLFLGKSEDIGDFTNLFQPLEKKFKIFRAKKADSEAILHEIALPTSTRGEEKMEARVEKYGKAGNGVPAGREKGAADEEKDTETEAPQPAPETGSRRFDMRSLVERTIMERYAPPGVLVDSRDEVRYFHGDTSRYLSPPRGEPSFQVEGMVLGDFQHQIHEVLAEARKANRRVIRRDVPAGRFEESPVVDLVATPLISRESPHELVLLTFEEKEGKKTQKVDARIAALERELLSTRQDLQATIEELESSNEELQSANEELQANNEELQSANEELATSREEMESTNEELEVVNAELEGKNEALTQAKDDVANLFNATGEGTMILDPELRIKRYTPAMTDYFKLIESDIGRPVTDIVSSLRYDALAEDAHRVLERLETQSREIQTREGRWVQVRIQPYRTGDNVIAGVVVTCADLTRLKESEIQAQQARRFSEAILATTRRPLIVLNGELCIVSANQAFYKAFDVSPQEAANRLIYEVGDGALDIPGLRRLLEEIIPERSEIFDYAIESGRNLVLNARRLEVEAEQEVKILISFEEKH